MLADVTFWAFVGLVLFLLLMAYLRVPAAMTGALDKRADAIRDELAQAKTLREEAQALLAEYQRRAREAESEAEEIVDHAKREAEAVAREAQAKLDEYVETRTRQAEQKISQAEAQAAQEVRALSAEIAVSAAQKILERKVSGETADRLVSDAISEIRTRLN